MKDVMVVFLIILLFGGIFAAYIFIPKLINKAGNGIQNKIGENKNVQRAGQVYRLADRYPDLALKSRQASAPVINPVNYSAPAAEPRAAYTAQNQAPAPAPVIKPVYSAPAAEPKAAYTAQNQAPAPAREAAPAYAPPVYNRNAPRQVNDSPAQSDDSIRMYAYSTGSAGTCEFCKKDAEELYKITMVKGEKEKVQFACRKCGEKLKTYIDKVNSGQIGN